MKLSELMEGITPDPKYSGDVTADDMVFAIDLKPTGESTTKVSEYAVLQMNIAGLDANLNPVTSEKTYIRAGKSTQKTGTQRTFKVTGDRYVGDEAQDYCLSNAIKYGTGHKVVTNYVYFNLLTGLGEKGQVTIIVNNDGSGDSGDSAGIDIEFRKIGDQPKEYTWSAGE